MNATTLLREQLTEARNLLDGTMESVTNDQAVWKPAGAANPLGATYAHAVLSVDMAVNALLRGNSTLASTTWASRLGLSEPPPGGGAPGHWGEWAQSVKVDLPALRDYARAVFEDADSFLSNLPGDAAARGVDLSAMGFGTRTLGWVVSTAIMNLNLHCGEIACLKGIQGLKGYPI